jgi:hypothetical protein
LVMHTYALGQCRRADYDWLLAMGFIRRGFGPRS